MVQGKTAVVTGCTGQDGYYLTKHLLSQGYQVIGVRRRSASPGDAVRRVEKIRDGTPNFHLVDGDVTDMASMRDVVGTFKPDHFYHLAAQSHVAKSWSYPEATAQITGLGVLNCLEAIRREQDQCRFYFAGSSEQFGNSSGGTRRLTEDSPMSPESPYAAAKVFGFNMVGVYRRSYGLHASCGILFNHESPLRGEEFVTRKITSQLARVKHGQQATVKLGNTAAKRDWGFAGDYVVAMHKMLQQETPGDFVVGTGTAYSVQDFVNAACAYYKLDPSRVVEIDEEFMRPQDVNHLLADASKAQRVLGWRPSVEFGQLVSMMCRYDEYFMHPNPRMAASAEELI